MRTSTGWGLLICCAVLTACTAAPKGPDATVTTPAVGRPPAPASVAAAMSSEVFTPYAALGAADNDGLAPGDTYDALHTACMNDAGYGQYAADAQYPARTNRGLGFVFVCIETAISAPRQGVHLHGGWIDLGVSGHFAPRIAHIAHAFNGVIEFLPRG